MSIWPATRNTLAWAAACECGQWGHAKAGHFRSLASAIPNHLSTFFLSPNPPNCQHFAIISHMPAIHMNNHFGVHVASLYLFPALMPSTIDSLPPSSTQSPVTIPHCLFCQCLFPKWSCLLRVCNWLLYPWNLPHLIPINPFIPLTSGSHCDFLLLLFSCLRIITW